jgi:hypothetical protein
MPRELSDERCELVLDDRISNSKITLYYEMPTTEDRIGYTNEQLVRRGNKVKNQTGETRIKYALKILKGFRDGDFTKGKSQPIASDPQSPHYDPAWKAIVKKYAADILELLAIRVFEVSVVFNTPEAEEPESEEDAAVEAPAAEIGGAAPAKEGKEEHPL